jgi:hypothetical protein
MILITLLTFITSLSHAVLPQDWLNDGERKGLHSQVSPMEEKDVLTFNHILEGHESLLEKEAFRLPNWRVDRFDVELGVNLKGEFGVLATSGQAAVEVIWQRKQRPKDEDTTQDLHIATDDPKVIESELYERIHAFINLEKLSQRKRKKIIKILRQDAMKISTMIREMATMPRVGDWYVAGFFKIYTFSAKGDILAAEVGHDKRIRFRFSFTGIPLQKTETDNLKGSQHFHLQLMRSLDFISRLEDPQATLRLRRVRARIEFEKELDLIVFSTSAGYSLQPFYLKVPDEQRLPGPVRLLPPTHEETFLLKPFSIGNQLTKAVRSERDSNFELSQLRAKFSWRLGGGFSLATLEKNSVLEFHFARRPL